MHQTADDGLVQLDGSPLPPECGCTYGRIKRIEVIFDAPGCEFVQVDRRAIPL